MGTLQEFIAQVQDQESKNISIDFDGVMHQHFGVGDGTVSGDIIAGAKEAVIELAKSYRIIIFTAKAKPDRPLVNGKTGTELVWEWLEKHGIKQFVTEITSEKPRAVCYIDDKAIRFHNWTQTLEELKSFHTESTRESA
jgi:hypothetical protein